MTKREDTLPIKKMIKEYYAGEGTTLLCGSALYEGSYDRRHWYPAVMGVDIIDADGVDIVHDLEDPAILGRFDHIDCCSVLEHVGNPFKVAHNLMRMLKTGGSIVVSVPFVWREHNYPDDNWRFTVPGVEKLFPEIMWEELAYWSAGVKQKKAPSYRVNDVVVFERTEVVGFGYKW